MNRWDAGQFYELATRHFNYVTMFNGDIVDYWNSDETVDGNTECKLLVAKVEGIK
jgi:hypothetical protein